jgi:DNA-binding transcriptional LysR family regulator
MLDWDDLRYFLALARHGSLSSAAKDLRVAQSTVGRRLASLETSLGVRLMNRTPDGYVPTQAGVDVHQQAERLEAEALALERSVAGRDTRLAGHVRVACTETMATHILAPCFARMQILYPEIVIELIPTPREVSLSMREADICLHLRSPEQHDLVIRRIGTLAFGLYAGRSYLQSRGDPDFSNGCAGHTLITQHADLQDTNWTQWLQSLAPRAQIAMRTGSHDAAMIAASHGGGLACLARFRADQEPSLMALEAPVVAPSAELWLVVHRDNRATPRIRAVLTAITEFVGENVHHLNPSEQRSMALLRTGD